MDQPLVASAVLLTAGSVLIGLRLWVGPSVGRGAPAVGVMALTMAVWMLVTQRTQNTPNNPLWWRVGIWIVLAASLLLGWVLSSKIG